MSITTTTAIQAYSNALADFQKAQTSFNKQHEQATPAKTVSPTSFSDTLHDSLNAVNDLQTKKNQMITSFAAGETQNVHDDFHAEGQPGRQSYVSRAQQSS